MRGPECNFCRLLPRSLRWRGRDGNGSFGQIPLLPKGKEGKLSCGGVHVCMGDNPQRRQAAFPALAAATFAWMGMERSHTGAGGVVAPLLSAKYDRTSAVRTPLSHARIFNHLSTPNFVQQDSMIRTRLYTKCMAKAGS